ncbi:MFS transporter [Candidatus Woesebacteria bacterium]|nr:MFS transporter [Candidatus Woesebacteria bacterium]
MPDQLANLHSSETPLLTVTAAVRSVLKQPIFRKYLLILLFWGVADGTISTLTPVIIEENVVNPIVLGLVYSFSSLVGFSCDFIFSKVFHAKSAHFFMKWFIVLAILMPLWYMFVPATIPTLLIAMAIWGIYYELVSFSNFSIIREKMNHDQHSAAWGLIQTAVAFASTITIPLLAFIASYNRDLTLAICTLAMIGAALIFKLMEKGRKEIGHDDEISTKQPSFITTLRIWRELMKKVWPLVVFFTILYLSNVTVWTVGILLAHEMQQYTIAGYALLTTFTVPYLFVTIIPPFLASRFSKKKAASACGVIGGVFLVLMGLSTNAWLTVIFMLIASIVIATAIPLMQAVFEDYVARLDSFSLHMVGIQSAAISFAYMIGPTLNGFIVTWVGNQRTFAVIGSLITLSSLLFLVIIHGKIRMPHQELEAIAQ